VDPSIARRLWNVLEPIHAAIYFAPESRERMAAAGLKGFWMGYFASRAAPFGAAPAPLVTATFFNFHPAMVERAIPDAWSLASPEAVLAARYAAADAMWDRIVGDVDVAEAAALATQAALAADPVGRPLFAAHAALDWPATSHGALWHAATLLREHRGDGHIAALVAEGVSGCAAHVLAVASEVTTRDAIQPHRGWSDEEWNAAAASVAGREAELRERVETRTDAVALAPYEALGQAGVDRLLELTTPIAARIMDSGNVPVPNPIGIGSPARRPA
jgi:hypothetical protein